MVVEKAISDISLHYTGITVDKHVVMPDHVHMILTIKADEFGRPMGAPTISTVINQFKGFVSKQIGFSVWQKLYFDHVIRGIGDYEEIWNYIDKNPEKILDEINNGE